MIFVCKNHVKSAIEILNSPHISELTIYTKCYFCSKEAIYKVYYYEIKVSSLNKSLKVK